MEIVEQIVLHHGGGAGFGREKDVSSNLEDMNYAERLIMNKEMLEAMATLKVAVKVNGTWTGGSILLSKSDIPQYFKKGDEGMNGACHYINKVFIAAGFPFYATSYSTDNAEKVLVKRKRGKHVDKIVKSVIADRIRIYRITNDFDINKYACIDSDKVKVEGINPYHQYTEGMFLRENKWLQEHKEEMKDTLLKLGYS